MMENYSFYSYLAASSGYGLLLLLALIRSNKYAVNVFFTIAICISFVWSGYIAFILQKPTLFFLETLPIETLRNTVWLFFLIHLISHQQFDGKYGFLIKSWKFYALLLLILIVLSLENVADFRQITQQIFGYDFLFVVQACFAIAGLVLIEQLYRNGDAGQRWSVKFLCLGVGTIFIVDFILYSQSLLYLKLDFVIWNSRGFIHVLIMPLLAVSINRLQEYANAAKISASRQVVFHTAVLFACGVYLIIISLGGYYIKEYGGKWGEIALTVFISFAILLILIILLSGTIRAKAIVFFNKNFFQYKYNYREEWLQLSKTLAELNSLNTLSNVIIKTMADLVGSTGGGLWLKNEQGDYYLADQYKIKFHSMQLIKSNDSVIQFLINRRWIIDFTECSQKPHFYTEVDLSEWNDEKLNVWLIIPLFQQQDMKAFVVLGKAVVPRQLNWEDHDLLRTVAMQLIYALALSYTSDELAHARQFEAYNRLSAYLVHDLKNLVAQISLIVKNAETFKNNPEFIDDSLDTLKNVSNKLRHLVGQLKKGDITTNEQVEIDLVKIIADVSIQQAGNKPPLKTILQVEECQVKGEKDKMTAILGHLVQNAQEACNPDGQVKMELSNIQDQAVIKVTDNGCGMDDKFMAERLFKPFDTTKGNAGMGIGVYEARDYILKQSGQISVESTPGQGTIFTISLPLI